MHQPKDKDWPKGYKNKTPIYAVYKRPTSKQGHIQTEREQLEKKIFWSNREQKKAGVAILISDNTDFEIKTMIRDKEGHNIMIKGSIQELDITIINTYAANIGVPQHVRQMVISMKGEIRKPVVCNWCSSSDSLPWDCNHALYLLTQ